MNSRMGGKRLGLFAALLLLAACSAPAEKTDNIVRSTPAGASVNRGVVNKLTAVSILKNASDIPFIGNWALTIPGGGAGWLGIEEKDGKLSGSILWGGGSVLPVDGMKIEGDKLVVTRFWGTGPKDRVVETITAIVAGDDLKLRDCEDGPGRKTVQAGVFHRQADAAVAAGPRPGESPLRRADQVVQRAKPRRLEVDLARRGQRLERQGRPVGEYRGARAGQAAQALRQSADGAGIRGLPHHRGSQRAQGRQQRRLPPRDL